MSGLARSQSVLVRIALCLLAIVVEIATVTPKEVSCKIFQPWARPLAQKELTLERVLDGTTLSVETIRDSKARISWADVCTIHRNLRPYFSEQELVQFGHSFFRSRALRYVFLIARPLLSPMGFYRWTTTPRKGAGAQVFACITPRFEEISSDECVIELTLPDGYEVSWEFFLITRGSFEEAPRLLGYGAAKVQLERLPNGGRFHIVVPKRTPFLTRIRRAMLWPFTARAVARELRDANETLEERYEQLEKTTAELEHYKNNLEKLVEERTAELRQARDQLATTVDELEQAQQARERFFGNISHEIRTPLSLILLAAADIRQRAAGALDERSLGNLGAVSDAAHKLLRLVDELLLLAAGQEDKLRMNPEPVDLVSLVEHAVIAWRPSAEAAGLELHHEMPRTLAASVDPTAIERVVSNLLSNAIKYTPRGGRVRIELAAGPDTIRLSVLDTGLGIDPELATRLFGRFERAAGEDRRKAGTGIGLALVKELVQAHGGTVGAYARPMGGTEIRVELPGDRLLRELARVEPHRQRLALAPEVKPTIASGALFEPPGLSNGRILLAEDDAVLAETIARLLADEYTVVVALDGAAAAELVGQHQPHLLVTDVDMPGLNGIELSKRFRERTGDRLAPIIILSAVLDLGTRLAGLEAGAVDYVTKPFDPLELRARVRSQFRMRELAVRLHRAEQLSTLGILTSGLAHEIRNPANGIVNAIAPLRSLLPADVTRPETGTGQLLSVMGQCASQIASLSRQLLSFRNGGADLDLRPESLEQLVDRAFTLAHRALEGVDARKQIAVSRPLRCAGPLLVQVLSNLVENAGHAAKRGGWVEVRAASAGGRVTVEVADSGPGVPLELRDRIFEPFFTTKPPGIGTGLGLSVARAIVARHGGILEVRDRGGRHAFVIELPDSTGPEHANAVESSHSA